MVGSGLVNSLARPGGNTTGMSILATELDGKRQGILIEASAGSSTHGRSCRFTIRARSRSFRHYRTRRMYVVSSFPFIGSPDLRRFRRPSTRRKASGAAALNVLASPIFFSNRQIIIEQVAALHLPSIYQWPENSRGGWPSCLRPFTSCQKSSGASGSPARQAPARRQTHRSAGPAADQVRAGDQSQDCEGVGAHHFGIVSPTRRQGDRMMFATSVCGPSRPISH